MPNLSTLNGVAALPPYLTGYHLDDGSIAILSISKDGELGGAAVLRNDQFESANEATFRSYVEEGVRTLHDRLPQGGMVVVGTGPRSHERTLGVSNVIGNMQNGPRLFAKLVNTGESVHQHRGEWENIGPPADISADLVYQGVRVPQQSESDLRASLRPDPVPGWEPVNEREAAVLDSSVPPSERVREADALIDRLSTKTAWDDRSSDFHRLATLMASSPDVEHCAMSKAVTTEGTAEAMRTFFVESPESDRAPAAIMAGLSDYTDNKRTTVVRILGEHAGQAEDLHVHREMMAKCAHSSIEPDEARQLFTTAREQAYEADGFAGTDARWTARVAQRTNGRAFPDSAQKGLSGERAQPRHDRGESNDGPNLSR